MTWPGFSAHSDLYNPCQTAVMSCEANAANNTDGFTTELHVRCEVGGKNPRCIYPMPEEIL
jgi:hypothetical protein